MTIDKLSGKNSFLSNSFIRKFSYRGREFWSAAHAFLFERVDDRDLRKKILETRSLSAIREIALVLPGGAVRDFSSTGIDIDVLYHKFGLDPLMTKRLLATGCEDIVYPSPLDNSLGLKLMTVRRDLARDEYVIQNKQSYHSVYCWWALESKGYTFNIDRAQVFTREEAMAQHARRETDVPWPLWLVRLNLISAVYHLPANPIFYGG